MLKRFWQKLSSLGLHDALPREEWRYVIELNRMTAFIFFGLIAILCLQAYFLPEGRDVFTICLGFPLACSLVFFLQWKGWYLSARLGLVLSSAFLLLACSYLMGPATMNHLFLLTVIVGSFYVFPTRQLSYLLASNILVILILAGLEYVFLFHPPSSTVSAAYAMAARANAVVGSGIFLSCMTFINYYALNKAEEKAVREKEHASELLDKITITLHSVQHAIFEIAREPCTTRLAIKPGPRNRECQEKLGLTDEKAWLPLEDALLRNFDLSSDVRLTFAEALHSALDEDRLAFELNAGNYPDTVTVSHSSGQRYPFALSYSPLLDQDGIVKSILVSMTDRTHEVIAEQERAQYKRKMAIIYELVSAGKSLSETAFSAIRPLLERAALEAQSLTSRTDSETLRTLTAHIFVPLHTVKGNARTLGFTYLASAVHQVENALVPIRDGIHHRSAALPSDVQGCLHRMDELAGVLGEYLLSMKELGWGEGEASVISINKAVFDFALLHTDFSTLRKIAEREGEQGRLAEEFLAPGFVRFSKICHKAKSGMNTVARMLGKPVPDMIMAGDAWMTAGAAEKLVEIIPHILGNLLDHGIESPEERLSHGKPEKGSVRFQAWASAEMDLMIDIDDDGRGISLDQLREKASSRGILSADDMRNLPDDEVLELLFHDGFSTKDNANMVSGRGIGMSAIRMAMASFGGTAQALLGSALPDGRRRLILRLVVPDSQLWWLDQDPRAEKRLLSA